MTKFSESIIGKIKCERIAPVPRWHFLFKGFAFWIFFGLSMILGSLSFSVVMHIASNGDLSVLKHLQGSLITSTVMLLPYFWLLSLILFAVVAYFNWRCTKKGYLFRRRWIVLGSAGLSVFFGSIFYAMGMGNAMDRVMVKSMPFYDASRHKARNELWLQPEIGLVMGKVVSLDNISNQMVIQDVQGRDWQIDEKEAVPNPAEVITVGKIVKVIGTKDGDNKFIAKEIRRCSDCQDDEDADDIGSVKKTDSKIVENDNDQDDEDNRTEVKGTEIRRENSDSEKDSTGRER